MDVKQTKILKNQILSCLKLLRNFLAEYCESIGPRVRDIGSSALVVQSLRNIHLSKVLSLHFSIR